MGKAAKRHPRLTRQDWIDAAFDLLIEGGIGSVSIDQLAGRLGITRGSFYHHFSGREDMLQAVLDYWAEGWTYKVREQISNLGLDPATTLLALMRTIRKTGASALDAPFRAWALHDPMARKVVKEVDEARLAFIRSQFLVLGFNGIDAENRARLLLNYEMAAPAMYAEMTEEECDRLLLERHRFLTSTNGV